MLQLAPDVAEAAGADRERLAALGEALRLPRLVRALETLGRAMVEMRDTPDPTVVLEIALVRVTRPELDPSPAAMLERLERLERAGPRAASPVADTAAPARTRPPLGELRPAPRAREDAAPAPRVTAPARPAPTAPRTAPAAAPTAPNATSPSLDRDALTVAWGDVILPKLTGRVRALFQSGRFTSVDGATCTFAVDKEALDQYEYKRADVEAALAAHFGTPVRLRLEVDDAARPTPTRATAPSHSVPDPTTAPIESIDLTELDGGPVHATESVAAARVLDAFPGATEVSS